MEKPCRKCGEVGELAKRRTVCKTCWNKAQYEWRQRNKQRWSELKAGYHAKKRQNPEWTESERKRGREYWARLRKEALAVYGEKCACCGESEPKFLSLDHVFNNGAEHRRQIKHKGSGIWKWLKDHGYPGGFQTLCMNCNFGRYLNGGTCPHKEQGLGLSLVSKSA